MATKRLPILHFTMYEVERDQEPVGGPPDSKLRWISSKARNLLCCFQAMHSVLQKVFDFAIPCPRCTDCLLSVDSDKG